MLSDAPEEGAALLLQRFEYRVRIRRLEGKNEQQKQALHSRLGEVERQLEVLRERHRQDEAFARYEAERDEGIDLSQLSGREMRRLRGDLQIIFQDPYSSLNPRMTVEHIVAEGPVTHGMGKRGTPALRSYVLDMMRQCGLQEHMMHRYPHEFSGGQRQRVGIARALAVDPKFVVCDECVSALDVSIQSQIINLLQQLKEQNDLTYLFITHDLAVVRYMADRIGVMYLGDIVELGDAEAVFEDPRHPYTVALLSCVPSLEGQGKERPRILLGGSIPSPIHPPAGCKFHTRCYMACDVCRTKEPPIFEVSPGHIVACHFPEKKICSPD
ncbi:MAG: ATP-binding cassette domain-containing protein [Ruminococcaceae bacterium]|nr:ATP-binding cassette domain-containing protein [Oscillospiraceae bacterium]